MPARRLAALLALALAGCLTTHPHRPAPAAAPRLDPGAFFLGATRGEGVLAIRSRARRAFTVESRGERLADGVFRLDQTITFDGEPPQTRFWLLERQPDGRYAGSLSGAAGPVRAEVEGSLFHVRYRLGRGMTMEQWLTLQPDGRTVLNLATVRALGVPIARLAETITRPAPVPR